MKKGKASYPFTQDDRKQLRRCGVINGMVGFGYLYNELFSNLRGKGIQGISVIHNAKLVSSK
jgi:hypothetical protein